MRVLWNTPRKKDLLMKCKNCGHEVNENDVYCSHCGTKLEKEETQVDEKINGILLRTMKQRGHLVKHK